MIRPTLASPLPLLLLFTACSSGGTSDASTDSTTIVEAQVWQDTNGNGLRDLGEPGIGGASVILRRGSEQVATTVTDANGDYTFDAVPVGPYTVEIATPAGRMPTRVRSGADSERRSHRSPAQLFVPSGSRCHGTNFGYAGGGSIGDRVWFDRDGNGLQDPGEPGLDGVRVVLTDANANTIETTTIDGYFGFWGLSEGTYSLWVDESLFSPVLTRTTCNVGGDPAADSDCSPAVVTLPDDDSMIDSVDFGYTGLGQGSIGDLIWHDLNADGLQDAGEPGIAGITVELRDLSGNALLRTRTDASGNFLFEGLPPAMYVVDVVTAGCFTASPCNVGTDPALDSECAPVTVTLAASQTELDIDFGFEQIGTGQIGDFVWKDTDEDGVQDAGEPGIEGVVVTLADSTGAPLAVQRTDANGAYLFQNLCAGTYQVSIDTIPTGTNLSPSPAGVGSDPSLDSSDSPATVVLAADDSQDGTVDFGLSMARPYEGRGVGYWKNHPNNWPSPYEPETLFSDVFEDAFPGMTLMAVASQGGGQLISLGRHTVAALLNAESVGINYPLTTAEVIAMFNDAFPGTNADYSELKEAFEHDNDRGHDRD